MSARHLVLAGLAAWWPASAAADVLTADNRPLLCIDRYNGLDAVDPDRLAMLIASESGASMFLDGANSAGLRDGVIQLQSSNSLLSEPAYAVVHAGLLAAEDSNRPFGPGVDLAENAAAAGARDAIDSAVADLALFMDAGTQDAGSGVTYRLVETGRLGSSVSDRADAVNPIRLFGESPPVIVCELATSTDDGPSTDDDQGGRDRKPPPFTATFALRGSVEDLSVPASDVKDADAATIGFSRDDIADIDTFEMDGVVGLRIANRSGSIELVPFLSYERKAVTGDGDVHILSPGLLVAHRWETPTFAVHSRLEASFIDDMEQGSHQGKLRLYVDPAIWLGAGQGVLFGSNLPMFEPLLLRPELTLIGDATNVYRAGTSEELADVDDYWGLGFEGSVRARLNVGSPISDFVLRGGVRHVELFGEIELDHARRWFGSLDYAPDSFPYLGLGLEFSDGRNDDSFQPEDTWSVGVKLRY